MRDLKSPTAIKAKACLFLFLGFFSTALLLARTPSVEVLVLIGIIVWSFCRAYYFAFYVIETYLDTTYKYSGLISLIKYLVLEKRFKKETTLARIDK
jgi:hypothetical protein